MIIGIIGIAQATPEIYSLAYKVGQEIGRRKSILVCGGLGGTMEAAAKGAKEAGGLTIGILPGNSPRDANKYIDVPVVTDMGHARNIIIVRTADVIIAIYGGYGTLSELAIALKLGKPIVGINTWDISDRIISVEDPILAVKEAVKLGDRG